MPEYQFKERHSVETNLPVESLWHAVKAISPGEIGVIRSLMAIRSLPAKLVGRTKAVFEPDRPLIRETPFFTILEEIAPQEIVLGMAGQFWKLDGGPLSGISTPTDFQNFQKPDHIRVTVNFEVAAGRVSTETRIQALDEPARRKFGLYWTLIRPGSGWIRIAWLRAICRKAEKTIYLSQQGGHR